MRRNNFDHFCFLLALLAGGPALVRGEAPQFPPQDLTVRVWSQEQGLPDNSVTAVLQTQDDYLWIGTAGGLARFDGVRFVPVVSASEKSNVVIRVTALGEDAAGGLWIGTQDHGLLRYADGLVRRDESLPNETVNSLAGDAAGNLWLGTPNRPVPVARRQADALHEPRRPAQRLCPA